MAKEILKDEILSDEELDAVTGGTFYEYRVLTDILPANGMRMTPSRSGNLA